MKLKNSLAIILTILFFSSSSHAGFSSAGDVYSWCTDSNNSEHYFNKLAECRGYISGVFDHSMATTLKDKVCLSESIKIKQVVKIFTAYIDKNPHTMHLTAESVIENAMYEAF